MADIPDTQDDSRLGLYGLQLMGMDLYADPGLNDRLTEPSHLVIGKEVFTASIVGVAVMKIAVTRVDGLKWNGKSGALIVTGEYQPNRYQAIAGEPDGGWAMTAAGDVSRLAKAEF